MNYWSRPAIRYTNMEINSLKKRISNHFNIKESDLYSNKRYAKYCEARSIFMYISHKHLGKTCLEVAKMLNRHHATVLHACNKVQGYMEVDKNYATLVNKFK
jgi:chromosomal replication initiator protein